MFKLSLTWHLTFFNDFQWFSMTFPGKMPFFQVNIKFHDFSSQWLNSMTFPGLCEPCIYIYIYINISKLGHHRLRRWFVACLAQSHQLIQCWLLVIWNLLNKFHWNENQNFNVFKNSSHVRVYWNLTLHQLYCLDETQKHTIKSLI